MSAPFVNSILTIDVSPLAEAVIKPAFISYNTEPQLKESKCKCFIYSFLICSVFRKYLLEKMVLNKRLHLVGNHTRFPKSLISGLSNGLYPGIRDNYSLFRHTQTLYMNPNLHSIVCLTFLLSTKTPDWASRTGSRILMRKYLAVIAVRVTIQIYLLKRN